MHFPLPRRWLPLGVASLLVLSTWHARAQSPCLTDQEALGKLSAYDVTWNEAGSSSLDSMPLGNGDIAANVWVEKGGDLMLYVAKSDAWAEDPQASDGLLKLGRVRIHLDPDPFRADAVFRQQLRLQDGAITINAGPPGAATQVRVWVDANHPVLRIEIHGDQAVGVKVDFESLRTPAELKKRPPEGYTRPNGKLHPDTLFPGPDNSIAWAYRSDRAGGATFGAVVQGPGMRTVDRTSLKTAAPTKDCLLSIVAATTLSPDDTAWLAGVQQTALEISRVPLGTAWQAHQQWWNQFWQRSWIFVEGDRGAEDVTRAYVLQRFMNACAGRGGYPIKFNGSLFTMDHPVKGDVKSADGAKVPFEVTANGDFRRWGGDYWFQNTRLIYWPMFAAGDFDLTQPFFRMYGRILEKNAAAVQSMYGFQGASYFQETTSPFGGVSRVTAEMPGHNTRHYFTGCLEYLAMLLDDYRYTGDRERARTILIPSANQILRFFFQFFPRDGTGKLLLAPDNAIESFFKVKNPTPDIAGLRWVLQGLAELPDELSTPEMRADWEAKLQALPPVPTALKDGRLVIIAAEDLLGHPRMNTENPELYAVFPFRLYGVTAGRDVAANTYAVREIKKVGDWYQDPIHAAFVGSAYEAGQQLVELARMTDPLCRFPGFWAPGYDYTPSMDGGGVLQIALQAMLLQPDGKNLLLFPAWPPGWNVQFKLHAPRSTTIRGCFRNGAAGKMEVTPGPREQDIRMPGK